MSSNGYIPFGFQYPEGFPYHEKKPDPLIETVRARVYRLNEAHAVSGLSGEVFTAALDLFQAHASCGRDAFWTAVLAVTDSAQLAEIAKRLADLVAQEPPRLDFPNAISLFDCRFLSQAEWEHIRRYSIGGSEAAAVLGLSHYQSPRTLYFEKKNPPPKLRDFQKEHIFAYGHAVETYVVRSMASILGAVPYPEYRMFAHREYPFITCNPDSIFQYPDGHFDLFEAKTAFRMKRQDWYDGMPDYYVPQPRQYLEVLNDPKLAGGHIGVVFGGSPSDRICHPFQRDVAKGAEQIQRIAEYWNDYIVPGVLPPLSGVPELDLESVYKYTPGVHDAKTVETLPDDCSKDFERYFTLKEERVSISAALKAAKETESALMDEITKLLPDGLTICTSDTGPSYRVDCRERVRETVATAELPTASRHLLQSIAQVMKQPGLPFTTPKVSQKITKGKKP
ncbi:MAG TPA: YqaJ viral recombinase family protein [Candidatus Faecousia intestinigallinarum]|nr:YqaJ viral recombinase family protein [Candidatus Faecousia intestinigallinarum]